MRNRRAVVNCSRVGETFSFFCGCECPSEAQLWERWVIQISPLWPQLFLPFPLFGLNQPWRNQNLLRSGDGNTSSQGFWSSMRQSWPTRASWRKAQSFAEVEADDFMMVSSFNYIFSNHSSFFLYSFDCVWWFVLSWVASSQGSRFLRSFEVNVLASLVLPDGQQVGVQLPFRWVVGKDGSLLNVFVTLPWKPSEGAIKALQLTLLKSFSRLTFYIHVSSWLGAAADSRCQVSSYNAAEVVPMLLGWGPRASSVSMRFVGRKMNASNTGRCSVPFPWHFLNPFGMDS